MDDLFVGVLLDFESFEGLEFLEGDKVEKDEAETEDVRLERVGGYDFFGLYFDELRSEKGDST